MKRTKKVQESKKARISNQPVEPFYLYNSSPKVVCPVHRTTKKKPNMCPTQRDEKPNKKREEMEEVGQKDKTPQTPGNVCVSCMTFT